MYCLGEEGLAIPDREKSGTQAGKKSAVTGLLGCLWGAAGEETGKFSEARFAREFLRFQAAHHQNWV